jgi:bacterioferritin-associated ferredoxin
MIVCSCRNVNEKRIKEAGATSLKELRKYMKVGDVCGICVSSIKELLRVSVMEARGAHNPKDLFDSATTQPVSKP